MYIRMQGPNLANHSIHQIKQLITVSEHTKNICFTSIWEGWETVCHMTTATQGSMKTRTCFIGMIS